MAHVGQENALGNAGRLGGLPGGLYLMSLLPESPVCVEQLGRPLFDSPIQLVVRDLQRLLCESSLCDLHDDLLVCNRQLGGPLFQRLLRRLKVYSVLLRLHRESDRPTQLEGIEGLSEEAGDSRVEAGLRLLFVALTGQHDH